MRIFEHRVLLTWAFVIVTACLVWESRGLSGVASMIPRFVLPLTLFLAVIELALELFRGWRPRAEGAGTRDGEIQSSAATGLETPSCQVLPAVPEVAQQGVLDLQPRLLCGTRNPVAPVVFGRSAREALRRHVQSAVNLRPDTSPSIQIRDRPLSLGGNGSPSRLNNVGTTS